MPTTTKSPRTASRSAAPIARARRKFLRFFPKGFFDPQYLAWERDYKWHAHQQWQTLLDRPQFQALLDENRHAEIAARAVRIESRTNLLFSFEKMAFRDAVKSPAAAKLFAQSLFTLLHTGSPSTLPARFEEWIAALAELPRRQTRVLTWPLATVFPFLAQPQSHFFLKPQVTRRALTLCGLDFAYHSRPDWPTYSELLTRIATLRSDLAPLHPRDMIDLQSFLWVQGSDEYN